MTTEVRRATSADAAEIADVIGEILRDPEPVGFDSALQPDEVRAWMQRQGEDGGMWVVADARGQVLAFAAIDFDSSLPHECSFGAWVRPRNRRQGHATELAEVALNFARERGYQRIQGRLPQSNEPALSFLSAIGALVPITNPGASFELPIYEERS